MTSLTECGLSTIRANLITLHEVSVTATDLPHDLYVVGEHDVNVGDAVEGVDLRVCVCQLNVLFQTQTTTTQNGRNYAFAVQQNRGGFDRVEKRRTDDVVPHNARVQEGALPFEDYKPNPHALVVHPLCLRRSSWTRDDAELLWFSPVGLQLRSSWLQQAG